MDEILKQIDTKRKLIQSTCEALKRAIDNKNLVSIERQRSTITKTANEVYELNVKVQELRIRKVTAQRISKLGQTK